MYWVIVILLIVLIICLGDGTREGFQEMFGFSGMKDKIDNTAFTFGSSGDYPDYTEVTGEEGLTHDEVNTCVKSTMKFINNKLNICSYPVETSNMKKLKKGSEVVYQCQFMFMVTSTSYPFMIGIESDIKDNKVIRASTQDIYRGTIPMGPLEDNFKDFSEIENFKVYSR